MSGEYYTLGTAVQKSGYSPRQIKNYADMGYVQVMERNSKTYYTIDCIPPSKVKKCDEDPESKNRKYFKMVFELLDILEQYFPISALKGNEFDRLHDELIRFEQKCERLGSVE